MENINVKNRWTKAFAFVICFVILAFNASAQNMIITAQTQQQLVDSLLGGGVSATNVTYSGHASSKSAFSSGSTIGFPIDKGIILSSGFTTSIPGWNTSGMTSDGASGNTDTDLNAIIGAGLTTTDKCVLEFDFVATSDSIQFEYIFASEEYPEFACGSFNDVFAFLLSGQNPAGGNYIKKNLALVPGTSTFVSVNSVNAGVFGSMGAAANCNTIDPNWASYSGYYNDNPKNMSVIKIKADGYTDIFTAKAAVINGQTYHIKLAIADVGSSPFSDNGYDSYVFIKAKSFTSPGMSVSLVANPTSICAGSPAQLTATVTSGTPNYTYSWSNGTTNSSITTDTNSIYVTPATNTNYTVTVTGSNGISATATVAVTVSAAPTATINYAGSPFCKTMATAQGVTLTGTTGGTYTVAPAGLTINATTGAITPSTSTAGTYTVTYTIPAGGGCAAVLATTTVTINPAPTATISYTSPVFCTSVSTSQPVTLTGTENYTGGTYSVTPAGLTINTTSGAIIPNTSTPGSYSVSYSIPASGGCSVVIVTTNITITNAPTATISYSGSPYCSSIATAQGVTLTGTSGGTYTVAPAGLTINATTGAITPSTSTAGTYTVSYTIPAGGGCAAVLTTTTVTITSAPAASISYAGSPFCTSLTTPQSISLVGTTGGSYSSTAGLIINTTTGAITPSTSTPGNYVITYTIAASGGCAAVIATTNINITVAPTATISYPGSPYCSSIATAQGVTLTGTSGGTYTVAPAGLTINATTGAITPSTSTAGTYTVSYTIPAGGGCAAVLTTTTVTITSAPAASISYAGSPFCTSTAIAQPVTLIGTTGGTYSSSAGLIINSTTGAITPNTSTPGTYTVSYTIPANGGCAAISATSIITITAAPAATINYNGSPFCTSLTTSQPVILTGTSGGTYSATPAGLSINATTGAIAPNLSSAGSYTITYIIPASSGCASVSTTANISITAAPSATISYSGSPFCTSNNNPQAIVLTGTSGGIYSVNPNGLNINTTSGTITPSTSTAGTYTVTYTIAANGGCAGFSTTTNVTITTPPTATISYGSPFCKSITAPQSVSITGATGGSYTAIPTGLSINSTTGAITPSTSNAGTYIVTYTLAAAGGCAAVTVQATVTILDLPNITISGINTVCVGNATTLTASGATSYIWSNGEITPSITVNPTLPSNSYSVTGTLNGCVISASMNVTANTPPTVTISGNASICAGELTALTATGATSYTWSNGSLDNSINVSPQTSNTYVVTGTTNGCSTTASLLVNVYQKPLLTLTPINPDCGVNNGSVLATINGTGNYTYTWSNGFAGSNNTNLAPGSYLVTVSDGICSSSGIATLADPNNLVAGMYFTPRTTTLLDGNVNFFDASTGDATSWNWSFGDGTSASGTHTQHYYSNVGTYLITLVIANNSGCTDTIQDSIVVKEIFTLYVPSGFTPDENSTNDGFQAVGVGINPDTFSMSVYDRWGGLMFYTNKWVDNKSYPAWKGTKSNNDGSTVIGVYSYIIHVTDLNGKQHSKAGSVSIVK